MIALADDQEEIRRIRMEINEERNSQEGQEETTKYAQNKKKRKQPAGLGSIAVVK